MIVNTIPATVEGHGFSSEMDFGISRDGLPLILNILRNKMYSNKPLAVIRELSCNAYDAMVEAGRGSQPIKVTLPNELSPNLKIRDYGKALSPDELRSIFVQYGASTKRGSNEYIGQMGIGAKSPFAYTDSFMVVSYQGGVARTYSAFLDPSQIGKMVQLGEGETTEEDGLEVVVPIRQADYSTFIDEASNFFNYWKTRPIFDGAEPTFNDITPLFQSETGDWIIPNKAGNSYYHREKPVAIMGNVPYAIDPNAINWNGRDELSTILATGIRIWVNIGDLEVSASRESLEYTPATTAAILEKLEAAQVALVKNVNLNIENAKSLYEAKILYRKLIQRDSPLHELSSAFKKVTYKDKPITSDYFDVRDAAGFTFYKFETCGKYCRSRGINKVSYATGHHISCDEEIPVIMDDIGITADQALARLSSLITPLTTPITDPVTGLVTGSEPANILKKKFQAVYLLKITDAVQFDAWQQETGFDIPLSKLSNFPKVKLGELYPREKRVPGEVSENHNPKHSAKVFEFKYQRSAHRGWGRRNRESDYWQPIEVDLEEDEIVYMTLDRFVPHDGYREWQNSGLQDLIAEMHAAGVPVPQIVGVKQAQLGDNIPANLQSFCEYMKEALKVILLQTQPEVKIAERKACLESCGDFMNNFTSHASKELTYPADGPIGTLLAHFNELIHESEATKLDNLITLCQKFVVPINTAKVTLRYDIPAESRIVRKRYPIFARFGYTEWANFSKWKDVVQQFIDLIDAQDIKKNIYQEVDDYSI